MSAKPSPLPDPDLSPTKGETQDRRKVGLKGGGTLKKGTYDDFPGQDFDESMGGRPQEDTIVPDRRNLLVPRGDIKPIQPAQPKERSKPIEPTRVRPDKFQASTKARQSKHAYSVRYKT